MSFDSADPRRTFRFSFAALDGVAAPSEIFLPHYQVSDTSLPCVILLVSVANIDPFLLHYQYPSTNIEVEVSDGQWRLDPEVQTLYWTVLPQSDNATHTITVRLLA